MHANRLVVHLLNLASLALLASSSVSCSESGHVSEPRGERSEAIQVVIGTSNSSSTGLVASNGHPTWAETKAVSTPKRDTAYLESAAEEGDVMAQLALGVKYAKNLDPENAAEAERWIRGAAEKGHIFAQAILGWFYYLGYGVDRDISQTVKWFLKASETWEVNSKIRLNSNGGRSEEIPETALKSVYVFLGRAYTFGTGVDIDTQEGSRWLLKAARLGDPEAQFLVGAAFYEGNGVAQSDADAVRWLRRSANQGHPHGQGMLAVCYAQGRGVPQNRVFAYMWLNLSLAQSWRHLDYFHETFDLSRKSRDELAAAMTGEKLAEAQRLSAAFVPKMEVEPPAGSFSIPRIAMGPTDRLIAAGSGFFLTSDGYLITSHHVLEAASYIVVHTKTEKLVAILVQSDPANDLALLKVSGQFTPLGVTTSRSVRLESLKLKTRFI